VVSLSAGATQAYTPSEETLIPDTPTVAPGGTVVFDANGFRPGSTVTFTVNGSNIGTAVADAFGVASISWVVPAGQASGRVTASAVGVGPDGEPAVVTATVTVTGSGGLPATGSDSFGLVQVAMVLLAVGAVGVVGVRRRSDSDDSGRRRSESERLTV
jgi:LPXTG-motif cell wall-anchored protein